MGKKNRGKKTTKQQQIQIDQTLKMKRLMGWTSVIIFLFIIGFVVWKAAAPQQKEAVDSSVFQYDKHPSMGSNTAPVKMVEFADFKCPSCRDFDQNILPQLKKEFIDTGKVQFYFINYPIISPDADSRTAAMAAEAIYHQDPAEFWKFYQATFDQQGDEHTNWATSDALVQIAKQSHLRIDYDKLKKEIDNNTYAGDVKGDEAIGDKAGVNGTPTIFINGKEVSIDDTFNFSAIKDIIQKASQP